MSGVAARLRSTPGAYLYGSAGGAAAFLLTMHYSVGNRVEQFVVMAAVLWLAVWNDGTRRFLGDTLPFFLFGVFYDLTHITEPLFHYLYIHVAEPYFFDRLLFGIRDGAAILTPNEYFGIHYWPVVDFFTGLAYIIFVYWAIGFGVYLALARRDEAGRSLLRRFGWAFLGLNIVGIATYYVYPAAPPWYVADYGIGPANLAAQSSAAATLRWDQLTGIPYFTTFYGRSADVFGAIPSLHVAYPLITFVFGRELHKRWLDVSSLALFLLVCFSAVYLNHHYVLDVLLGVLYTLTACAITYGIARPADSAHNI